MIVRFASALASGMVLSACVGAAQAPTMAPTMAPTTVPTLAPTEAPTEAPTPAAEPTATTVAEATAGATTAPAASAITLKIVPEESKASYAVDETFLNENNKLNTAIGVTGLVNGEIMLDTANPANTKVGEIAVDISALKSDSGRRDGAIQRDWLESSKFPMAKFVPTRYEGLPAAYESGQDLTFKIIGDMTVKETTVPVTWDVVARYDGSQLTGTATTQIKMSDFNFEAPNIAGMLRAEDDATLTLEFVARP